MGNPLEVTDLTMHFRTFDGLVRAVDGITFHIKEGEVLALVGESGCGKSVTARSVMGLYGGSKTVQSGRIVFLGEDLSRASAERRQELRGKELGMIFQEPMSAFDPLSTISDQMLEARRAHFDETKDEARKIAVEALRAVGIPDPGTRIDEYPYRLSGGMLQRVLIAMAVMNRPRLLIADEPTTALDVTIQAQVLRLLCATREETGASLLFITHDLGVVSEIADRVHVMYAGRILEKAAVRDFYGGALHPYSKGLLESRITRERKGAKLPSIPGSVPGANDYPEGCRFAPRCPSAGPRCAAEEPRLLPAGDAPGRETACHLFNGGTA